MLSNRKRDIFLLLAAGAILASLPILKIGDFYLYLIRLICIYSISALGLNIFWGYCGQINFGTAGFFCIGAYLPAMLQIKLGWHYLVTIPTNIILTLLVAWGVSFPLLRLRGHAMAIGTLSFGMVVYFVADRFPSLTGGSDGIVVPPMVLFSQTMGDTFYYYFILFFSMLSYIFCYLLIDSRIGRAWRAIRDDEAGASAMGIDSNHYKTMAWLINGVLCSLSGTLYAQQAAFLAPATFSLWTNVILLLMICLGGLGSNIGSVLGAAIMTLLPFLLVVIQTYTMLVTGIILFLVLRFMPRGVVGLITKGYFR